MRCPSLASLRLPPALIFESDHLSENLAAKTARGGLTNFSAQAFRFSVQTISTVVLARILTPSDYGLVAMVTVFIGVAGVFKDAGLSLATVQRDEISEAQVSAVFWLNMAVILGATVLIVAASPLVAAFYGRRELTAVTVALGLAFLVNGLSVQHDALLRRHMRFRAVAATQLIPLVLSFGVSLTLALLGWRYWALVSGVAVTAISSTVLSFYLCPWVPGRMRRGTGARSMVKFGRDVTTFNVFHYFARSADNILIGRFLGADAVGLYGKAYSLFMLPMMQVSAPISDVAIPALSALKYDPDRFRKYYCAVVGVVALVTVPLALYCVLEGDFVIRLLLGPSWSGAAPAFRVLSIAGVVETVVSTILLVSVPLGRTRRHMVLGIVNGCVLVAAFALGLRHGIIGVAAAYAVASLALAAPTIHFAFSGTPIAVADFLGAIARPLGYSALATLAALAVRRLAIGGWLMGHTLVLLAFVGAYVLLVSRSRTLRDAWHPILGALRRSESAVRPNETER